MLKEDEATWSMNADVAKTTPIPAESRPETTTTRVGRQVPPDSELKKIEKKEANIFNGVKLQNKN